VCLTKGKNTNMCKSLTRGGLIKLGEVNDCRQSVHDHKMRRYFMTAELREKQCKMQCLDLAEVRSVFQKSLCVKREETRRKSINRKSRPRPKRKVITKCRTKQGPARGRQNKTRYRADGAYRNAGRERSRGGTLKAVKRSYQSD